MQVEICGLIADGMGIVLGIMPTVIGELPLSKIAVQVTNAGLADGFSQQRNRRFDLGFWKGGGQSEKSLDHVGVILHQHGGYGIEFRTETEQGEISRRPPPKRPRVCLIVIEIAWVGDRGSVS